jgi:hypothetical protein
MIHKEWIMLPKVDMVEFTDTQVAWRWHNPTLGQYAKAAI